MPRLHAFLPADTVLEIGPGHGRWTQFLKDQARKLILVDMAESCITACRDRFASDRNVSYHVNDGRSLPMVSDRSVDLAFSFDSLVHAEADVLEAYAREMGRTLKPNGIGFIHHSNMGALRRQAARARAVPARLRPALTVRGLIVNLYAWRADTPTAQTFASACAASGLTCIGQEKIAWEYGRFLTDAVSLVTPVGSRWERTNITVENPGFMDEARGVATAARLYGRAGFPASARL